MDSIIRRGFSVKVSRDSEVQKRVVLEVDTTGATEEGILELALKDVIIRTQQKLRDSKRFAVLTEGEVVQVNLVEFLPRGARMDPMKWIEKRLEACETRKEKIEVLAKLGIDL